MINHRGNRCRPINTIDGQADPELEKQFTPELCEESSTMIPYVKIHWSESRAL